MIKIGIALALCFGIGLAKTDREKGSEAFAAGNQSYI